MVRRAAFVAVASIALFGSLSHLAADGFVPGRLYAQTSSPDGSTVVAAISYRAVERPPEAPASFIAPDGVSLRFLSITAIDGVSNLAAFVQPQGRQPQETPLVLHVHGSGGNLYEGNCAQLALALTQQGYAGLTINTRQHDDAVNTDNFYDVRNDLAAATAVARSLGYRSIVLHGQSLGSAQVLYYAATDWSPEVKGVVLTGPFAHLPWKTQYILVNNDLLYQQLYDEALAAVRAGHPDAVLADRMPYLAGAQTPITAQHFLTYRWQYSAAAVSVDWIRRVTVPLLLVRDSQDQTILAFEPNWLYSAATSYGALSPDVQSVLLPDSSPGNGHTFPNTIPELADLLVGWLQNHDLD